MEYFRKPMKNISGPELPVGGPVSRVARGSFTPATAFSYDVFYRPGMTGGVASRPFRLRCESDGIHLVLDTGYDLAVLPYPHMDAFMEAFRSFSSADPLAIYADARDLEAQGDWPGELHMRPSAAIELGIKYRAVASIRRRLR